MSSRYLDMVRSTRRRSSGFQFTAKSGLIVVAVVMMLFSCAYWWGIQSVLTPNKIVAGAFTMIMVLAPPALVSFLIPWSPGGMLLQKINARTWGYTILTACALVLLYYSVTIQYQWWATQPVVVESNLTMLQAIIGNIGTVIVPALVWTPVSDGELVEQIRQAHLVRRYELQTQADIAILRATLLRAQEKALIGFANLTVKEQEELASVMRGLVRGIDATMKEFATSVKAVSGATAPFTSLDDNSDIKGYLDYVADALTGTTLSGKVQEPSRAQPQIEQGAGRAQAKMNQRQLGRDTYFGQDE